MQRIVSKIIETGTDIHLVAAGVENNSEMKFDIGKLNKIVATIAAKKPTTSTKLHTKPFFAANKVITTINKTIAISIAKDISLIFLFNFC